MSRDYREHTSDAANALLDQIQDSVGRLVELAHPDLMTALLKGAEEHDEAAPLHWLSLLVEGSDGVRGKVEFLLLVVPDRAPPVVVPEWVEGISQAHLLRMNGGLQ